MRTATLILILGALVAAGCGGDEETETTAVEETTTEETTTETSRTASGAALPDVVACLDQAFAPTIDVQSGEVSEGDLSGGQVNLVPGDPVTEVEGVGSIVYVPTESIIYFFDSPTEAESQVAAVERDSGGRNAEVIGDAVAAESADATSPDPQQARACLEP